MVLRYYGITVLQGKKGELEATRLIAAYFPMLIKDELIATE